MNQLFYINSTISKDSRTDALARYLLSHLQGDIEEINLQKETNLHPLDQNALQQRENGTYPTQYAKQFSEADTIVIAAPYYDLSFPSLLKIYIEMICCQGMTFYYDQEGNCQNCCRCKKVYYVTTSGGRVYKPFGFEYIQGVFSYFFKTEDVELICAQNLDVVEDPQQILQDAMHEIDRRFTNEDLVGQ